ncbi:MAG: hypothetical protein ABJE10_23950, partial [bacterium]
VRALKLVPRSVLDTLSLDMPALADTGVCKWLPPTEGRLRQLALYRPQLSNAVEITRITLDTAGAIIRYDDTRRRTVAHAAGPIPEQLDSAMAAARAAARVTVISADFAHDRFTVTSVGGQLRDVAVFGKLSDVANNPRFGPPAKAAARLFARCGHVAQQ